MPWRNFLSPDFRTKFQREVPLFLEITEFPLNTMYGGWKEAQMSKTSSIRSSVSIEHRLVTDGRTQAHGQYRGCIASRGRNTTSAAEVSQRTPADRNLAAPHAAAGQRRAGAGRGAVPSRLIAAASSGGRSVRPTDGGGEASRSDGRPTDRPTDHRKPARTELTAID